ncbi:MAG: 4Fe-4S dicluster domain-containing protein [Candidatus Lokiarchaeota archaeon]|nr:4Fe-4S dicluster domain-containing protein [Candidatus Lokiarchaeota archaeon]
MRLSIRDLSTLPDSKLKEELMKFILNDVDVSDELYQKSFKEPYKVNIDICGLKGYQIYEPDKYTSKLGENLEDPDLSINFRDIEYIRQLLRGEKVGIENGRDKNYTLHVNRKDLFISTNRKNAQVLMAKIPLFDSIVKNFGTSRQAKRLRDESGPLDPVQEGEIVMLMKKMLKESVDTSDELYRRNFQGQVLKVNWDINGNISYQIFEETKYSHEFGKHIEDADLTLVIENPDFAKRFLLQASTNYAPGLDDDNNLLIYIKTPVISIQFKNPDENRFSLVRLPFFRTLMQIKASETPQEEKKEERENYGHYISVNLPMGDFENVVVPYKVFEHFINKASNIVLRTCPCRERWACQNHSIELGCIFMGDDTKNMALSPEEGYIATKEQALEHLRKAIDEGLVPLLGRNVAEAEDGHGVMDTGSFLSGCFCCECCCIGVKTRQYGAYTSMAGDKPGSIEGMKIKIDYEKCVGCGTCVETCPFKFRKVVDGKAAVDPNQCIGCGRCINVCPNGAIMVNIEDPDYIEKFIAKIESIVDVTDQNA